MDKDTSKVFQTIIGNKLREAREAKKPKVSQSVIAEKHSCTKNYLSEVELGNIKLPAEVLMWYYQELELDVNELFKKTAAEMDLTNNRNK